MRASISEELAEFRQEVKAVLDTTSDAPLVVGDIRRRSKVPSGRPPLNPTFSGHVAAKSAPCRGCTAAEGCEMMAVDRELTLLERSNATLFATLEQTGAMHMKPLPGVRDGRMLAFEAEEQARASLIFIKAAEIKERERRGKIEKRRLVETNSELKKRVSYLERDKIETVKKLEDKLRRHEWRQVDARQQEEKRHRKKEMKSLRHQVGSTAREADLLREKLKTWAKKEARTRAREALWRWRARAAASAAKRERKERLAAEKAMAVTKERDDGRDARGGDYDPYGDNYARRRVRSNGAASLPGESSWNHRREVYQYGGSDREYGEIRDGDRFYPEVTECGRNSRRVTANSPVYKSSSYSTAENATTPVVAMTERGQRRERVRRGSAEDRTFDCRQVPGRASAAVEHVRRGFPKDRVFDGRQSPSGAVNTGAAVGRHSRKSSGAHCQPGSPEAEADGRRLRRLERKATNSEESAFVHTVDEGAATFQRQSSSDESRHRMDEQVGRAWPVTRKKRAKVLARCLALMLRARLRERKRRRLQGAFNLLRLAATEARQTQKEENLRMLHEAYEDHFDLESVVPFRANMPMFIETRSLGRQTAMATAIRDRRANAASDIISLYHRCRLNRLRQGFDSLATAAKVAAERERRSQRTLLLAAREERAARTLLLTKSWSTWRAFTARSVSAKITKKNELRTMRVEAEKRHLRGERLALVCKAAFTASDMRRKARAWRFWQQLQEVFNRRNALLVRVLVGAAKRRRTSQLQSAMCRWRGTIEALRKQKALERLRLKKLRNIAASRQVPKPRQAELARAFRIWARGRETWKAALLQKRQAARILSGVLRSSRRDLLVRAMGIWKSVAARRARLQKLSSCIAHRQRVFLLNRAWSRIMWAAGEREAARARKLGAARAMHSLLASSARASRRRAWLRWKQMIIVSVARQRLQRARRAALRRCQRSMLLRDKRAAWKAIVWKAEKSSAIVSGAARLEATLFRSRRRALAHRLGMWRSVTLAEAIAVREEQTVRGRQCAAARLLASTASHARRRQIQNGWKALVLFAADNRRAEEARLEKSQRVSRLVQMADKSSQRRLMTKVWRGWLRLLEERKMRGAVGAATSSLEGQKDSLAILCKRLKLERAAHLLITVAERSERARLRRGWQSIQQATHRRAVLVRSVTVILRSRSQLLRRTLYHWRVVAVEARAEDARADAGEPILKAFLAGVSRRSMQPAWESWRDLVKVEREKEKYFADQRATWTAFSSVMSRLAARSNRDRQARALSTWRLAVARSAVNSAQAKANLRARKMERQHAGSLIALRWLRRREVGRKLKAWSQWTTAAGEERRAEELGVWRSRASVQFARELARAVERRRQRILRRSLQHWYREVKGQMAHVITVGQEARSREAGGRRLHAVLDRNLLGRKARAWARLVGTAVAASGRLEQERDAQRRRVRYLTAAEFRTSRRLLSKTWLAWKRVWAEGKHAEEVRALRAQRAAQALRTIIQRRNDEVQRFILATWRGEAMKAREKKKGMSALVLCLIRSRARAEREMVVRCFAQWRVVCAVKRRAMAEKERSSAEAIVKGQAVVAVLKRIRLLRLSEGFRRLIHHGTLVVHETKKVQALRDNISRGLCTLRRVLARRSTRYIMASFVRWRWYAAEIGQQSDRALLVSARTRAAAQVLGAMFSRREVSAVSLAWSLWRSGVAAAAVYDGERASADLRVSDARRSAGVRLLATTIGAARRRVLSIALGAWRREAKNAADASIRVRKTHINLARTLLRIEKRNQAASVHRAWRRWNAYARTVTRLGQILRRTRTARMADAMNRWRLTCLQRQQAAAEERRAAAVTEMRARAITRLVEARSRRQLRHGFHLLIEHGAWAIFWSKERDARRDRQVRGFHMLGRAFARHRQRSKFTALSRWRSFAAECRWKHDKALLHAAGKRSGAKTVMSLVSRRSSSNVARAWTVWRAAAAAAGAQEGQRASADLRVVQANRVAGVRLLISAFSSARRRTLAKAWVVWGREKRAAAEAELRRIDKHFHLARTLGRVKRRVELARMGQAWREWRETVIFESQAEMQAMERNYNIAQTVTRVARRVEKRRLAKAWSVWARLAARGWPRVSESLPSFPVGFLAAARSAHVPPLSLVKADTASSSAPPPDQATKPKKNTERSSPVRNKTGAVALRGILRRAEVRSLLRSWQTWRVVTVEDAARESKMILGARRLSELLPAIHENHNARAVQQYWRKWTEWSIAESARLEQAENAASSARAEDEKRKMKAAAGAEVLARVTRLRETRALRSRFIAWLDAAKITMHEKNRVIGTEDPKERDECALEDSSLGGRRPAISPVTVGALRQKLRGEASPIPPKLPRAPFEVRRSPNGFMVVGSPSPRGREVCVTNPLVDDVNDDMPTTSQARTWLGEASRSSLEFSLSGSSSIALADRSLLESASSITAISDTDHGSLGLSTSQESGITSGSRSGKAARSRAFGSRSSPDSLEILSDSSPLLGVRILQSGGSDGGALGGERTGEQRAWVNGNGETVVQSPDGISFATMTGTPERSHVGQFESSDSGGDTKNMQPLRAPPYVGGSVHSWSLIRGSPGRDRYEGDEEQNGERGQAALESVMSPSFSDLPEEAPVIAWDDEMNEGYADRFEASGEDNTRRAEAFVARMCAIMWRRALKHWGNVLRDEAYRRRVMNANRKVISLRRNMKLRRVVVSAIRRQSYAWHMSDLTRAMRKWREFVRKCVDDERSSLEISRMSSVSPMTPNGPRSIASGLGVSSISDTNQVSEGNHEAEAVGTGEECMSSLPRSPFSPTIVDTSYARRLWDPSEK